MDARSVDQVVVVLAAWLQVNLRNEATRVSIKNAPGLGHLFPPVQAKWRADLPPWAKLREWIGGDVDDYIELMR